ncbi:MAG: hypothetical protein KAT70_06370, partial [Thermoplasmata archaeon]|nr:hypothetical protein [Thermoplasmata archaeon]
MKRAQALFAGILLSFLLISSIVSASITVTAPDTAEPGQIIIIQAAVPPGATNVTLHYKICTATSCGLPLTASMSLSTSTPPSEDLYEATIPAQEDGNEVEYSVTADVDGSTETSQEGKILVRSSSE